MAAYENYLDSEHSTIIFAAHQLDFNYHPVQTPALYWRFKTSVLVLDTHFPFFCAPTLSRPFFIHSLLMDGWMDGLHL